MSFLKKIEDDLKNAMKNKDSFRLGVLRLVKTALKNKEIDLMHAVSEAEFVAILSTLVKQRKDSVDQYVKAGRDDLAKNEQAEIAIIQEYLPKALSDDDLKNIIATAIQKTGAAGAQDMGKVMKEIKEATAGRVDGKILAEAVKNALQK